MIELEQDTPEHVVVATASGTVTADDYEQVLMPAVNRATAAGEKARLLYVLGEDFEGYAGEAALDDLRLGMHHWADFARIAVATDRESWRVATRGMGFLMPGEVRVFALADLATAREWLEG